MKRLFLILFLAASALAQSPRPLRPVHTFSIVARDPQTGEIGAAVQSHWFSVGSSVIWAEPGVGAVATQSFIDPSYGPNGLALMRNGKSAGEALQGLLAMDCGNNVRQVAFIDAKGMVATWTGAADIPAAGGIAGNHSGGFSAPGCGCGAAPDCAQPAKVPTSGAGQFGHDFAVQANLMANNRVWPAMDEAFRQTRGDLAERMLAALDAAQAAGGDIRGRQSAALIVVSGDRSKRPWEKIFDVRVDDAPQPLVELRRLVALQRAYNHMNAGDAAVERKDNEGALRQYAAAEAIAAKTDGVPQSRLAEMIYWHAVALVNMKRVDESLPLFKRVFQMDNNWRELTRRLPKVGLLPDDAKVIDRIAAQ
ncbi:MAG TPA: DUF1028 domain-containing protein [Terriglobales bacterium]|nr:DUF1028 domain-containing protein [Terriglobales bacterium]